MKRVGLILLLAVWAGLTWHRAHDWISNYRLWRSAVQVTPCQPRVHYNFAEAIRVVDPIRADREMATAMAIAREGTCVVLR